MCGRFASYLPPDAIRALFRTKNAVPNLPPSWNVAPTQAAMVVRLNPETNDRHLNLLKWGLIPHFTKVLKAARKPINARAETVASSGMFRGALERRRCLVHADAFYEWRAMPDGKQPYAIGRKDGAPLAFAGIWEDWRGPEGETLRSFAILTTSANATMHTLHDRMPVILEEEHWPVWLGERAGEPTGLMRPAKMGCCTSGRSVVPSTVSGITVRTCWTGLMILTPRRQATHPPATILRNAYCVMSHVASGMRHETSVWRQASCDKSFPSAWPRMSLRLANAANMLTSVEKTQNDTLTAAQCRMARAGLGLSITEASKASLVSRATITRFESGSEIKPVLRSALRAAFERLGVVITDSGVEIAAKREGEGA
jgi:putative SOS response-associated peptidase YedK